METTMVQELRHLQTAGGATVAPSAGVAIEIGAPTSFGNNLAAIQAARSQVALYDRTHWGRIQVADADRLRFLHNQSTNSFNLLKPGQGCDTVFVTSIGRTIDLATAYVLEDSVLLLVSPSRRQYLMDWMDQFIFFADKVTLKDVTGTTAAFSLIGPGSSALLKKLGAEAIADAPPASHRLFNLQGVEVRIAVGSGLATAGYTAIVNVSEAAALWKILSEAGAVPMGEQVWEQLRIEQGRPVPGQELTEDFNPLEAGLWQTISLTKGCYIGQETIARLHTYRGVKQQLWGVQLKEFAEPGSLVLAGEEKIGKLTSCVEGDRGFVGLAYIRTKAAQSGLAVQVAGVEGELIYVPFVTHEYL